MITNPITKEIFDIIKTEINSGNGESTTITNTEIAKKMDISAFTVRDKVIELAKRGFITKRHNVWSKDRTFHNRIIYLK